MILVFRYLHLYSFLFDLFLGPCHHISQRSKTLKEQRQKFRICCLILIVVIAVIIVIIVIIVNVIIINFSPSLLDNVEAF